MADETEDRGFKVVDRRSMSDEEREAERKAASPPPAPDAAAAPADAGTAAPSGSPAPGEPADAHGRGPRVAPPGFLDLLQSLQFSAMMHLGMVQGHDGKRSPVDLPAAQDAIDMMDVLKVKTKGNLTAEEDGMLTEGLYVLRMSYLAAMNAGKTKP